MTIDRMGGALPGPTTTRGTDDTPQTATPPNAPPPSAGAAGHAVLGALAGDLGPGRPELSGGGARSGGGASDDVEGRGGG